MSSINGNSAGPKITRTKNQDSINKTNTTKQADEISSFGKAKEANSPRENHVQNKEQEANKIKTLSNTYAKKSVKELKEALTQCAKQIGEFKQNPTKESHEKAIETFVTVVFDFSFAASEVLNPNATGTEIPLSSMLEKFDIAFDELSQYNAGSNTPTVEKLIQELKNGKFANDQASDLLKQLKELKSTVIDLDSQLKESSLKTKEYKSGNAEQMKKEIS
jgi:hypothetical protein